MNETYQIGLSPCPFCKSATHLKPARKIVRIFRNDFGKEVCWGRFYIRCTKCNARGPVVSGLFSPFIPEKIEVKIEGKTETVHPARHFYQLAAEAWEGGKQE